MLKVEQIKEKWNTGTWKRSRLKVPLKKEVLGRWETGGLAEGEEAIFIPVPFQNQIGGQLPLCHYALERLNKRNSCIEDIRHNNYQHWVNRHSRKNPANVREEILKAIQENPLPPHDYQEDTLRKILSKVAPWNFRISNIKRTIIKVSWQEKSHMKT